MKSRKKARTKLVSSTYDAKFRTLTKSSRTLPKLSKEKRVNEVRFMEHETCCAAPLPSTLRPFFLIILPLLAEFVREIGVVAEPHVLLLQVASFFPHTQTRVLICNYKTKWKTTYFHK